jgi:hypothetical protein
LETFFDLTGARFLAALTGRETVRCFGFADFTWVALRARAFPAGERLVAGFSLGALGFEAALTAARPVDREESFLTFFATGVLMRKLPRYCDNSLIISAKTSWKA